MLRTFHRKAAFTVAVAGAALILSAGLALAAGGWTIVAAPPTGQNATLTSVATVSGSDAWAVGRTQINKSSLEGLALHWNGTAWSVSAGFPAALSPEGGASAAGVADISPGDAYAIGDSAATAVGSLAHWNGKAWSPVTLPLPRNANSNTTLSAISAHGPSARAARPARSTLSSCGTVRPRLGPCRPAEPGLGHTAHDRVTTAPAVTAITCPS